MELVVSCSQHTGDIVCVGLLILCSHSGDISLSSVTLCKLLSHLCLCSPFVIRGKEKKYMKVLCFKCHFKITVCKLLRAERSTYEGLPCVPILCQGVYSFKEIKGQYADSCSGEWVYLIKWIFVVTFLRQVLEFDLTLGQSEGCICCDWLYKLLHT